MKKRGLLLLLCFAILCVSACSFTPVVEQPALSEQSRDNLLTVHVIDVGQGDSTFVQLPNGQTMLIDAGEQEYGATVCQYVAALGCDRIDYLVASHPHSDHIGGLAEVITTFEIGQVWMPKKESTTFTYENLLTTIQKKGLTIHTAKAGKTIVVGQDLCVQVLSPVQENYGDEMNLYSAVIKITYGSQRFLIMGDAEAENEAEMKAVDAEFIRVGHHGSKTSSSKNFVHRVGAKYAVISVGKDNSYGLPKEEIVSRWQQVATVYRTDQVGTVIARCDGKCILIEGKPTSVQPQQQQGGCTWILNTSSKKIHRPDCSAVKSIKESNLEKSDASPETLMAQGYSSCKICDAVEN